MKNPAALPSPGTGHEDNNHRFLCAHVQRACCPADRRAGVQFVVDRPRRRRKWNRGECRGRLRERYSPPSLQKTGLGSYVVCEDKDTALRGSAPGLQNIEAVIGDMVTFGLIRAFSPRLAPVDLQSEGTMNTVLLQITSGPGTGRMRVGRGPPGPGACCGGCPERDRGPIDRGGDGPVSGTLHSALLHLNGAGSEVLPPAWRGRCSGSAHPLPARTRRKWFVGVQRIVSGPAGHSLLRTGGAHRHPAGHRFGQRHAGIRRVGRAGDPRDHGPGRAISRDERSSSPTANAPWRTWPSSSERFEQRRKDAARQQRWDTHNELVPGNPVGVRRRRLQQRHPTP